MASQYVQENTLPPSCTSRPSWSIILLNPVHPVQKEGIYSPRSKRRPTKNGLPSFPPTFVVYVCFVANNPLHTCCPRQEINGPLPEGMASAMPPHQPFIRMRMSGDAHPYPQQTLHQGRARGPHRAALLPLCALACFAVKKTLLGTGSTGLKKICLTQRPQDPKGSSWNQPLMDFPGDLPISVYQCASVVEQSFSSSFVIFESFVVNPLQSLWLGRKAEALSTKLMIKPSSEQSERWSKPSC